MSQVVDVDLRQIVLSNSTFGPNEIHQIVNAISADYSNFRSLRDGVGEMEQQGERTPAASARLGVCQYLLGRYSNSVQTLTSADGGALTHYYLGKAYLALDKYSDALTAYESAERAGYNRDDVALSQAEARRYTGDNEGALTLLDKVWGDGVADGKKTTKPASQAPVRLAVLFSGNGFHGSEWWAKGSGKQMQLGKVLAPLTELREKLVFIKGLYNAEALKGNIHSSQTGNLLSGAPLASGGRIHSGTSFDQLVALHLQHVIAYFHRRKQLPFCALLLQRLLI